MTVPTTRISVIENGIQETINDKVVDMYGYKDVAYHSPTDTLTLAAIMNADRIDRIMYLIFSMLEVQRQSYTLGRVNQS